MNFVLEELKIEAKAKSIVSIKAIRQHLAAVDSTDYCVCYFDRKSGTWEPCHARSEHYPSSIEYDVNSREFDRANLQQRLEETESEYLSIDGGNVTSQPPAMDTDEARAA